MVWVAAIDAVLGLSLVGAQWTGDASTDDFKMQFGEYLTIPGLLGLLTIGTLIVLPLGASTLWALRRISDSPGRG